MEEKIKAILAGILEIAPESIGAGFGPDTCANWDSLGNLRIIGALEREFAVKLSWSEISSMTDFGKILDVIARHKEGG